jgi:hypothetical protein
LCHTCSRIFECKHMRTILFRIAIVSHISFFCSVVLIGSSSLKSDVFQQEARKSILSTLVSYSCIPHYKLLCFLKFFNDYVLQPSINLIPFCVRISLIRSLSPGYFRLFAAALCGFIEILKLLPRSLRQVESGSVPDTHSAPPTLSRRDRKRPESHRIKFFTNKE